MTKQERRALREQRRHEAHVTRIVNMELRPFELDQLAELAQTFTPTREGVYLATRLWAHKPETAPEGYAANWSSVVSYLLFQARKHASIQERWGNVQMSPRTARAYEVKEKRIELRIEAIVKRIGWRCRFDGDPRGYTVKLFFPDGDWNTWGGKDNGYGI